jgi:hypothetical protein
MTHRLDLFVPRQPGRVRRGSDAIVSVVAAGLLLVVAAGASSPPTKAEQALFGALWGPRGSSTSCGDPESDAGGTSRRSTTPRSTSSGSSREVWAWLISASWAIDRRSAVVSASTASTRP